MGVGVVKWDGTEGRGGDSWYMSGGLMIEGREIGDGLGSWFLATTYTGGI